MLKTAIMLALATATACWTQAADAPPPAPFGQVEPFAPNGAKISLRLPDTVVIGQEIPAILLIENTGTSAFNITIGWDRQSMEVRVYDESQTKLPELPPETHRGSSGFISTKTIQPGKSELIEFPLEYYVSFRKAGVYRVTASHDLGWGADPAHPRPIAETTLTALEATSYQAISYVNQIFAEHAIPVDYPSSPSRELHLQKKLCVLRHPVYLPVLLKHANAGSKAAVLGIGHIADKEATTALLGLLKHPSSEIVATAAEQLVRRVPSRENASQPATLRGWFSQYQIDSLLPSWDSEIEKPFIEAALNMLGSTDPEVVQMGAHIIALRGEPENAPAILDALQKALDIYQPPRAGPDANTLDAPKPQKQLIATLAALRQRGWRTTYNGGTARMVAWFCQVADPTIQTPISDDTRRSMLTWIDNGPATLRICALQAIPQPMPDIYEQPVLKALDDRDWAIMRVACEVAGKSKRPVFARSLTQIVEQATEQFLEYAAKDAALACGARMELWQAFATVIPDNKRMVNAIRSLIEGTIELPSSNGSGGNRNFTRDQRFEIRNAWRAFLAANQDTLSAGQRVKLTDPETIAALTGMNFHPNQPAVELSFRDGTRWPPR